jgi:hypothetical protein
MLPSDPPNFTKLLWIWSIKCQHQHPALLYKRNVVNMVVGKLLLLLLQVKLYENNEVDTPSCQYLKKKSCNKANMYVLNRSFKRFNRYEYILQEGH